jgi:hypothetical protein
MLKLFVKKQKGIQLMDCSSVYKICMHFMTRHYNIDFKILKHFPDLAPSDYC